MRVSFPKYYLLLQTHERYLYLLITKRQGQKFSTFPSRQRCLNCRGILNGPRPASHRTIVFVSSQRSRGCMRTQRSFKRLLFLWRHLTSYAILRLVFVTHSHRKHTRGTCWLAKTMNEQTCGGSIITTLIIILTGALQSFQSTCPRAGGLSACYQRRHM